MQRIARLITAAVVAMCLSAGTAQAEICPETYWPTGFTSHSTGPGSLTATWTNVPFREAFDRTPAREVGGQTLLTWKAGESIYSGSMITVTTSPIKKKQTGETWPNEWWSQSQTVSVQVSKMKPGSYDQGLTDYFPTGSWPGTEGCGAPTMFSWNTVVG